MSIHVQLSPEALARLKAQQRNSTITSIIISILVVLLICITLLLLLLPGVEKFEAEITTFPEYVEEDTTDPVEEITRTVTRPPSSTAPTPSRVIASNIESAVAIPTTTDIVEASVDFGSSDDAFDEGWADFGGESVETSTFGSVTKVSGTIEGYLYDFKQTPRGKEIEDYSTHKDSSDFADRVKRLQNRRYNESSLGRHYKAKTPLYLQYLAIPTSSAQDGPRFFQAEGEVEPSGWIAHYRGTIVAPKDGTFRFVGLGDDYLSVMLDDEFKLIASWAAFLQDDVKVKGANADEEHAPEASRSPIGRHPLYYGSWFTVRKGQELNIGLTAGERPGGKAGFILMIQEQGVEYRKHRQYTILPPFTMGPLSGADTAKLNELFPNWPMETENVPVFKAK